VDVAKDDHPAGDESGWVDHAMAPEVSSFSPLVG
jgi:hypothetical protein